MFRYVVLFLSSALLLQASSIAQAQPARGAEVIRMLEQGLRRSGVPATVVRAGVKVLPSGLIVMCGVMETAQGRETFRAYSSPEVPFVLSGRGAEGAAAVMGCFNPPNVVVSRSRRR